MADPVGVNSAMLESMRQVNVGNSNVSSGASGINAPLGREGAEGAMKHISGSIYMATPGLDVLPFAGMEDQDFFEMLVGNQAPFGLIKDDLGGGINFAADMSPHTGIGENVNSNLAKTTSAFSSKIQSGGASH